MECFSYTCQLDLFLKFVEVSVYFSAASTHRHIKQSSGLRLAEAVMEVTNVFAVSLT